MRLLWLDFTFDLGGDLFTASYKIRQQRWEIMSIKKYCREPVVIQDKLENISIMGAAERAKELVCRLV